MKKKLQDFYELYDLEYNIVNKNSLKCLLRAMLKNNYVRIEGQYYIYDESILIYLLIIYKNLLNFFDFYYSLKSDLISMFDYLINMKINNSIISFNAFFCPGYSENGGYKAKLGNTTIQKLKILSEIEEFLSKNNIKFIINCYYSDAFIENYDSKINPKWEEELAINRDLFKNEALKYFNESNIKNISSLDIFSKNEDIIGTIDYEIINIIPLKVFNSFKAANQNFYNKLNFDTEKINDRNDKLATMYIKVSRYINDIPLGIYLPMENMYDREKIIATNGTCTMYLKQELIKK